MAREIDRDKIEKQAKEIIDKFANALLKVEKEHDTESYVIREEFERIEKASSIDKSDKNSKNFSSGVNSDFKDNILKNAPNHDDDFVIAETGGWK